MSWVGKFAGSGGRAAADPAALKTTVLSEWFPWGRVRGVGEGAKAAVDGAVVFPLLLLLAVAGVGGRDSKFRWGEASAKHIFNYTHLHIHHTGTPTQPLDCPFHAHSIHTNQQETN